MAYELSVQPNELAVFKRKALQWAADFPVICCLDSNEYQHDPYSSYQFLLAIGAQSEIISTGHGDFDRLKDFLQSEKEWAFGFFGYDMKNQIESLHSDNPDKAGLPELYFFKPIHLIYVSGDKIMLKTSTEINPKEIIESIRSQEIHGSDIIPGMAVQNRMDESYYIETFEKIRNHIRDGDIYELNFCQEYFIENCNLDPFNLYTQFNAIGKTPFAAFLKWEDKFLISQSPERFLKKDGHRIVSQPIKGTIKRGSDPEEDSRLKDQLYNDSKERAENVMIVDLVRNDLAKTSITGSVEVEELFGIYTFPSVHQMISTVVSTMDPGFHPVDVIKNAFPMGSMTGAPKIRAMQLIEEYELTKRGLYSGAVGYFTPDLDFDFNVVIRSILYNQGSDYLSFHAGGAITWDSSADQEYRECRLKAKQMIDLFRKHAD